MIVSGLFATYPETVASVESEFSFGASCRRLRAAMGGVGVDSLDLRFGALLDAPLDDANVGKFTNMIRKFSDNSQFIIVTHNKQTMASVDVIYGVTMQEAGVSKLVPVDFRSLN